MSNADLIWELHAGCNDGGDLPNLMHRAARALEAADAESKRFAQVRKLLGSMPIQSAASAREPWAKLHLIDLTMLQKVADGESDPDEWVAEWCGGTFGGHSAHHWSVYVDGRDPLRTTHYCDGVEPEETS